MILNTDPTVSTASFPLTLLIAVDEDLVFHEVEIAGRQPSGDDIVTAAGANRSVDVLLLQLLPTGEIEDIRLTEYPSLSASNKFLISYSDRSYFFTLDGTKLEWPHRCISGRVIRAIGEIEEDRDLIVKRKNGDTSTVSNEELIDLSELGVEQFSTKPRVWKLRVQSVTLEYGTPEVIVRDAMKRAGFDPTKAWQIFLLVEGQPKKSLTVDSIVDLRTPGIEKIRLMQSNVDNGDGKKSESVRQFDLLDVDVKHLNELGVRWETILEDQRRWLLIHDFRPITGYAPGTTVLALDIPKDYPAAQIDMFYFSPWISRADGQAIPSTQVRAIIRGSEFQGWSRHRNAGDPWDPNTDNLMTHLALVEGCMHKEFAQ